jgi:hypothetical protein
MRPQQKHLMELQAGMDGAKLGEAQKARRKAEAGCGMMHAKAPLIRLSPNRSRPGNLSPCSRATGTPTSAATLPGCRGSAGGKKAFSFNPTPMSPDLARLMLYAWQSPKCIAEFSGRSLAGTHLSHCTKSVLPGFPSSSTATMRTASELIKGQAADSNMRLVQNILPLWHALSTIHLM